MPRTKASGDSEGRLLLGELFPRGAVTPQATWFPRMSVDLIPCTTALQILAYVCGLTNRPR